MLLQWLRHGLSMPPKGSCIEGLVFSVAVLRWKGLFFWRYWGLNSGLCAWGLFKLLYHLSRVSSPFGSASLEIGS
jgi:hypothetical protein